jgi:hypothetical protein
VQLTGVDPNRNTLFDAGVQTTVGLLSESLATGFVYVTLAPELVVAEADTLLCESMAGGVLSIFTAGDENVALLPALSVAATVPVTAAPSAVKTSRLPEGLVDANPDVASAAVNAMDTSVLLQPVGAEPNVSVGGVLSILIPVILVEELVLPALSMQVPLAE